MNSLTQTISTGNPPKHLEELERKKSRLLFEAHLFKAQQRYADAADNFAQVAQIERQWITWADAAGLDALATIHRRSELSCWAQAGYPHRALQLADELLSTDKLNADQAEDLTLYRTSLQQQFVNWMGEWATPAVPAD